MTREGPEPSVLAPAPPAGLGPAEAPATFSVVIPAYQAAATIGAAISSVLDQTVAPLELIVVDDGSTDDLAGAVRPFADRVELIRKSNGGAASARNAGMEAARGDFMAVLDADDRFHPRRLEALTRLAGERPDLDLVTTDARFVIGGEGVGSFLAENPFATEGQRQAILASCFVGGWPAARVGRLREVGGFDERLWIGHDWDCWVRMILAGSTAGLVDLPYYDYVLHPGGLTSSRARALWDRVRLLEKALANPDLKPAERPVAERQLARRRADAVQEEALGGAASRRALLRMATMRGAGRARALALLAAASPALARRVAQSRPSPEEHLAGGGE
jgi:hypothetical protein